MQSEGETQHCNSLPERQGTILSPVCEVDPPPSLSPLSSLLLPLPGGREKSLDRRMDGGVY